MELLILLPLILVMLFLPTWLTKRARDKQLADLKALQDSLVTGQRVITAGCMFGTVRGFTDTTVDLEIAEGVLATFDKQVVIKNAEDVTAEATTL